MDDTASAACAAEFAGDRRPTAEEMAARMEGITPLNASNFDVNDKALNADEELNPALVRARAVRLLAEGDGQLIQSCAEPLAPFATNLLLKYASEAVHELLEQQREAVTRSCGKLITKDLALGTFLGDALGIPMLPEEACRVGKAAGTQLKSAKDHEKAILGNAASKRTAARKSASKSSEREAGLAARLAHIDADRDAARSMLWKKRASLPLPEGHLVPQRIRPPPAPKPLAPDELTTARAALAAAQAALTLSRRRNAEAQRALARLLPPNSTGSLLTTWR